MHEIINKELEFPWEGRREKLTRYFLLASVPYLCNGIWSYSAWTTGTAMPAFSLARTLCSLSFHLPGGIRSFGNRLHQQRVHMFLCGNCRQEEGQGICVRAVLPTATLPTPLFTHRRYFLQGDSTAGKMQKENRFCHICSDLWLLCTCISPTQPSMHARKGQHRRSWGTF